MTQKKVRHIKWQTKIKNSGQIEFRTSRRDNVPSRTDILRMLVLRELSYITVQYVKSTQALAHVASSRIVVYTVSRWYRTQYLLSYSTVQYGTVQYGTVRYRNVRYSTLRYITVRYIILRVRYGTLC